MQLRDIAMSGSDCVGKVLRGCESVHSDRTG